MKEFKTSYEKITLLEGENKRDAIIMKSVSKKKIKIELTELNLIMLESYLKEEILEYSNFALKQFDLLIERKLKMTRNEVEKIKRIVEESLIN